jgi:hypothetical protein
MFASTCGSILLKLILQLILKNNRQKLPPGSVGAKGRRERRAFLACPRFRRMGAGFQG